MLSRAEALTARSKVFGRLTREPAIILCNGGTFLEGLDVWDRVRIAHNLIPSGRRIRLMISRFWVSVIPAE